MTKKVANRKPWRLAVAVSKAVAGKGWRAHLRRWNEGNPFTPRELYDRDMSITGERGLATKMREIVDWNVRQLDRKYAAERAVMVAAYPIIDRFAAETEWKCERSSHVPSDRPDEIIAEYLGSLTTENA